MQIENCLYRERVHAFGGEVDAENHLVGLIQQAVLWLEVEEGSLDGRHGPWLLAQTREVSQESMCQNERRMNWGCSKLQFVCIL